MMKLNEHKLRHVVFNECDYWIYLIEYKLTELDFPGARAYVRVVSQKCADQNDNPDDQYFVSSSNNPQLIMEAVDNRWSIEVMHQYKDSYWNEDSYTFMNKNAIRIMAVFNNIAYSLYRIASAIFDNSSMAETRIRFQDSPEKMLSKLLPLMEKQNLTMLLKENMRGRKKAAKS